MTDVLLAVLGWAGAAGLLAAYALVSTKRLAAEGAAFQLLNIAGGLALAVNSAVNDAWPSAVLNLVWIVIGVATIARGLRRRAGAGKDPATI